MVSMVLSFIYRNPYKLTLILGKKGSGKSMYCVKMIMKYLRKGWNVYTDIPDINIKGVHIINALDLEHYAPMPHSAIFLDEVGLTFDNRKFKTFADGINEFFKFQRKYKCAMYVNSQGLDVDLKIRLLVDRLLLMTNISNVYTLIRPIKRDVTLTDPLGDSESRVADKLVFETIFHWRIMFMPRYFKYFDSYSAPVREEIPNEISNGKYRIRLKWYVALARKIRALVHKNSENTL